MERMCATYQEAMTGEAVSYLNGRGIGADAIGSYRLGVVTPGGEHGIYKGMISIPYITSLAGVVGFKFRQVHDCTETCEHQKYLTPYSTRIFNPLAFDEGERLGYIAVCEGELDAIILSQYCGIPAVAVPGVDTWTQHKAWPLLFQGFSRVLVFKDNDEDRIVVVNGNKKTVNPGRDLAKRILSDVGTAHLVDTEGLGKDVTDIYLKWGADAIRDVADV